MSILHGKNEQIVTWIITGAGLGASHQTGWTGMVAKLIHLFGLLDPKKMLEAGKNAAFTHGTERKGDHGAVA